MRTVDKYTYRITWSNDDHEFVGLCAEFPSLSWLSSTPQGALEGIRKMVAKVLKDMGKNFEEIPQPLSDKKFSGKFMVRLPPEVHRKLALKALEEKVSLNRLISSKLTSD